MVKIVYVGPSTSVVVPSSGTDQECVRGLVVEVPDELAAALLEQDVWDKPGSQRAMDAAAGKPYQADAPPAGAEPPAATPTEPQEDD